MERKLHWKKDPAFWVVMVSFALFLAAALAVFLSSRTVPRLHPSAFLPKDERTQDVPPMTSSRAVRFTADARNTVKWIHFNLSEGGIVHPRFVSSSDWDLAFRRYHVIANGGCTNLAATGAILDLGNVDFSGIDSVPPRRFALNTKAPNGQDPENSAIRHWYDYDYASHILTPNPHAYLVRTPQNAYYAFRILNYYCRSGQSGCMTFEYYKVR